MSDLITYELVDGVATLTMDDGKVNALTFDMLAALDEALDRADADEAAVVLAGRDGKFSAGFDLKVLGSFGPGTPEMLRTGFELSARLLSTPRPVVIACTGHAFAMAAFLLLSADWRVGAAGDEFKITANEVKIGMVMPHTAVEITRQRLTPRYVQRVLDLAEVFDPQGAVTAGFLDETVAPGEVVARAQARAAEFLELNQAAHAGTKARVRAPQLEAIRTAIEVDDAEVRAAITASS